jgi:hypothetical protein
MTQSSTPDDIIQCGTSRVHLVFSATILGVSVAGLFQILFLYQEGKFGKKTRPILSLAILFTLCSTLQLVFAALGWLRDRKLNKQLQNSQLYIEADMSRIMVYGNSAGGLLALHSAFTQPAGTIKEVVLMVWAPFSSQRVLFFWKHTNTAHFFNSILQST